MLGDAFYETNNIPFMMIAGTADEMTPDQRALADSILAGPRTTLGGPFNVLLRSPELGERAQSLGAYVRFNDSLPAALREMAIIITARYWMARHGLRMLCI